IICSSVNLARFICPSFRRPDSNFNRRKSAGAGQTNAMLTAISISSKSGFRAYTPTLVVAIWRMKRACRTWR
ncbi:hypothetical protein, partial [Bradyrhizobium sp. 132]|uniref:hypothetical protein n=1 Tax=Bradyrhizobium sp. 132 TaxID=2782610 RepID=UPI00201BB4D5